jgi:hypothetical protein
MSSTVDYIDTYATCPDCGEVENVFDVFNTANDRKIIYNKLLDWV